MTDTVLLRCDWPARPLWQNVHCHWAQKARAVSAARAEAHAEALLRGTANIRGADAYTVRCDFYPPDRRKRDFQNMPATVKAHLDGIAEALGVDDHCFDVSWHLQDAGKPGGVLFTVSKAGGADTPTRRHLTEGGSND